MALCAGVDPQRDGKLPPWDGNHDKDFHWRMLHPRGERLSLFPSEKGLDRHRVRTGEETRKWSPSSGTWSCGFMAMIAADCDRATRYLQKSGAASKIADTLRADIEKGAKQMHAEVIEATSSDAKAPGQAPSPNPGPARRP